jgi:hypothetical protein
MDTNNDNIIAPSIESVLLKYKQKFKTEGVSKNTMSFERVEDMIFMCLSIFLHDYVHDYNLSGMHNRVIKGNISRTKPDEPSLFETLGITVGNTILKIFSYGISTGDRKVIMYDDNKFKDVLSGQDSQIKSAFYNYLNSNEELIGAQGGGQRGGLLTTINPNESDIFEKKTEDIKKDTYEGETDQEKNTEDEELPVVEKTVEELPIVDEPVVDEPVVDEPVVDEPVVEEQSTPFKTINFSDVKEILVIPSAISSLDVQQIVSIFEKNQDFLSFHSSLNTYVVTYLGYDVNETNELDDTTEDKDKVADKAIKASLRYIIDDLKNPNNSIETNFYGDIFSLLLDSYEIISTKKSSNNENPFDILNSSEILYQFIIFYVSYLTTESYDSFKMMINQMSGGDGTDDEEEIKMYEDDDERVEGEGSSSAKSEGSPSTLLPDKLKQKEPTPEYVFITHNNLLTTIARGMFIKLGIWRKIFLTDPRNSIEDPENYIFGPDELNAITYEKLVELFPINPKEGGNHNNELLILEILILKRLLVEMSPSKTLTFGAKIDDELKNYLDAFYFYLYNMSVFPQNMDTEKKAIPDDVINNPDFPVGIPEDKLKEEEDFFEDCEEDCDIRFDDQSPSSEQEGGNPPDKDTSGDIELVEIDSKKEFEQLKKESREKLEEANESLNNLIQKTKTNSVVSNEELAPVVSNEELAPVVSNEELAPVVSNEELAPVITSEDTIENVISNEEVAPVVSNEGVTVVSPKEVNLDEVIVEQPHPPNMPILFNKLKKMYQNNILVIRELENSKIKKITIDGVEITNLFELLKLNEVLIHREGSSVNIPAPKYKFVINNAAKISSNLNGSKMFVPKRFLDTITSTIREIKENVYDGEIINNEKLAEYIKQVDIDLNSKDTELNKLVEESEKIEEKENITIREYNELLKLKYDQKTFERTVIQPILNKLFLLNLITQNRKFYDDFLLHYEEWFKDMQPMFGLYRNLQRGVFCPTSSMMDAMDDCSLKHNATEPKEVGTSFSEIIYEGENGKVSFGGVVLNYNELVGEKEKLIAKIYYTLDCNLSGVGDSDVMIINTLPIQVSESEDLKAKTAYKSVVKMIKSIYDEVQSTQPNIPQGVEYIKEMWKRVQYQYNREGFNKLLSATALKTMGDYLQECQAVFKWGGYINNTDSFPEGLKAQEQFEIIKDKLIYRSVTSEEAIIPYDENTGDGLRLGVQGDRPSGSRSIYMLLNGEGDVNDQAMTGYVNTSSTQNASRTLLVARNSKIGREPNENDLKGSIIYVTRELRIQDRDELLRSLEFLNVKDKTIKVYGEDVEPEITDVTISGSQDVSGQLYERPRGTKPKELKNVDYEEWIDYNEGEFIAVPQPPKPKKSKTDEKKTEQKERIEVLTQNIKETTGLNPEQKLAKKVADNSKKKEEKDASDARKNEYNNSVAEIKKLAPRKGNKYLITTNWLDSSRESLIAHGIKEDIFEQYYNSIANAERISRLAEEAIAEEKARKKEKAAATSAEKKALKAQQLRLDQLKEKIMDDFLESEEGQGLNNRKIELEEEIAIASEPLEELKKPVGKTKSAKISPENQAQIDAINEEIKPKQKEIETINKQIKETVDKLFEEQKDTVSGGSYTRANRKTYKYKLTKRHYKNKNKLTKRHKKLRIPKRSRKNM